MHIESFHPNEKDFVARLSKVLPDSLVSFLYGLGAASASIWDQGGLMVEEVVAGPSARWTPSCASDRAALLEFFACVCGNRSLERTHEAEPALEAFENSLASAFPGAGIHLQLERLQPSWCCSLHVRITDQAGNVHRSISLFWSVD
jgi:hypothetical protein